MRIIIFFIICLSFYSCDLNTENNDIVTANAILVWQGDYSVDGCGFKVIIDGAEFKPQNEDVIPNSYKNTEKTNVKIEFRYSYNMIENCYWLETQMLEGIIIFSLENLDSFPL